MLTSMKETAERFDVAIVGLGPVGATLSHLLGIRNIKTLVLERERDIFQLPRAVHLDDEILRVFQWTGTADQMVPAMRINPGMRFVDSEGKLLLDWPRPQTEGAHGWHPSWRFHQPDIEKVLRDTLIERKTVTMRTSCDVFMIEERDDHVALRFEDMSRGKVEHVEAKYVVGCDGARSLVRRFIETEMHDLGFHERWLVIDVLLNNDKPELGDHSIQYCSPVRPATYVRGPDNRRRWEIAVLPDEDDNGISKPEAVWNLLARWLGPEEAELERSVVYNFHALVARDWRRGRLFIAGDAAHQTPPFMGQGMCAGVRDAANLGWKLAKVVHGNGGDALLNSYQSEREPNTTEFIKTAVRLGRLVNSADNESALQSAMRRPGGTSEMRSIYPPLGPGLGTGKMGGRQFPQLRHSDGMRMDDSAPYAPMIVAEPALAQALSVQTRIQVISTADLPGATEALGEACAKAVLLRPDRYILGTACNVNEMLDLLPHLHAQHQHHETVFT